jgi:hypothetical protein
MSELVLAANNRFYACSVRSMMLSCTALANPVKQATHPATLTLRSW